MAQQYQVDIVTRVVGASSIAKLEKSIENLSKEQSKVERASSKAANGIRTFGRNSSTATGQVQRLGRAAQDAGIKTTGMGKAMGFAVNAFKAFLGFQIGKFFLDSAAGIEKTQTQLKTLTGSAAEADKIFNELLAVAKQSPFSFEELTGAAAKLKAFGVETQDVVETTTQLGKVAAATGQQIDGIALAYGQVLAKGRLQGEELLQFQERGIPLAKELQKELGVTGAAFSKMVEKGQISSQQVVEAFNRMTGANGQFNTAFENTANLLTTKITNLQSSVTLFASAFTNAFGPIIKTALDGATMLIEKMTKAILLSADAGKLTQEEIRGIQEEARKIAESKVDKPWLNAAEASRIYNEELDKGVRKLIDQKLKQGEITNAIYDDLEAHRNKMQLQQQALDLTKLEAAAKKDIAAINTKNSQALSVEMQMINNLQSVRQAQLNAERAINDAKLQQANADLQAATTQEAREAAAKRIYKLTISNAKLEYESTVKAAQAESMKAEAAVKHAQVLLQKQKILMAEAKAAGTITKAHQEAVTAARDGLLLAEAQLTAQQQINTAVQTGAAATQQAQIEAAKVVLEQARQATAQDQVTAKVKETANAFTQVANEASRAANAAASIGAGGGGGGGGGGGRRGFLRTTTDYSSRLYDKYKIEDGRLVETSSEEREQQLLRKKLQIENKRAQRQQVNALAASNSRRFAEGGYVTGPTNALIGEGGEPEYVVPESKLAQTMANYSAGKRGSSMIPQSANVSVNYNGSTVDMGGTSYVNKGDVNGIVSQAVNQTLSTLAKSPRARLGAGMR